MHVCHLANVEAGQAPVADQVKEHEHSRSLHDSPFERKLDGLKRAEILLRSCKRVCDSKVSRESGHLPPCPCLKGRLDQQIHAPRRNR